MPENEVEKGKGGSPVEAAAKKLPEGFWLHPGGYLWYILPVKSFLQLPEQVDVDGTPFLRKTEFHVTVINARATAEKLSKGNAAEVEGIEVRILELLTEFVQAHPLAFGGFTGDLRVASTPDRQSIAARCTLAGVEAFFKKLEEEFGESVPLQPAHVSIYSREQDKAVGIDTDEQMEAFPQAKLPEVEAILRAAST